MLIPVLLALSAIPGTPGWDELDSAPMDNSQAPSSILDTLRTVEFRLGLKGYNVDEVDEYLDKAAQEAEGLQEHVRQLNERLRQASERIAQLEREKRAAPAGGRRARRSRPLPRRRRPTPRCPTRRCSGPCSWPRSSSTRPSARARPKRRRSSPRPRRRPAAAIAAAEATAAQLQAESNQKLREEVTRLESTRTELATDVESMARHLESERNRLRGALSEILKWVDENVQPANSLMGVRPKAAAIAAAGTGAAIRPRRGPSWRRRTTGRRR